MGSGSPQPREEEGDEICRSLVVEELQTEVKWLKLELEAQKNRMRELWKLNYECLAEIDSSPLE